MNAWTRRVAFVVAACAATFGTVLAADPPGQEAFERVENARAALVYVRPSTDWAKYKTVQVLPLLIRPRVRDAMPSGGARQAGESFVLRDKDVADLQQIFAESMRAELTTSGFTVVDTPTADTLLLAAELTDIVLTAPIESTRRSFSDRGMTITAGSGSLAIKAVVADSSTRTILAAAADRKYSHDIWNVNTRAGNVAEASAIFKSWARYLGEGLKTRGAGQAR